MMCFFDVDDRVDFYETEHHVAAKALRCDACGGRIAEGAPYREDTWGDENEDGEYVYRAEALAHVCEPCELAFEYFKVEHGSFPTADWLDEAVRNCFEGADKTDPDAAVWRSVYAGMLKRQRAFEAAQPKGGQP